MQPLTPNKLGRYEIVDELGKGAMGVVYLARDPLIGRLVALKTFRIGYSVKDQEMEQFRVRFMREAQSAGILTHPNIVTIHDVVEDTGDGLAFIAMEYVRGTNLKLLLQGDQPLSLQFVLDIVSQVAEALDYAHSNRVIHRDIKPANILITAENRVKITDFGIARLDSSNLTQEGQLLGTPNYMAPEQIQGKDVDWRADLFSLGIVLYEMLTRHKPFQGENLTVVSHRIVYDQFTPPQQYVGELPTGVDRILGRALEKEPARRYQRARELVDELRQVVETSVAQEDLNQTQSLSTAPLVPPPPLPPPAAREPRRHWWSRPAAAPPPAPANADADGSSASVPPPPPVVPPPPPPAAAAGDLNDTVATEAPPPAPRRPVLAGRWLAIGGILVALLILVGAAVKLWRGWSPPAPAQQAADDPRQIQIKLLLNQGYAAMRRGDFEGGVARFRQAEQLAPGREDIRRLRERAEDQAKDYNSLVNQEKAITENLASARRALAAQKYEQAATLAGLVLGLEPENQEAEAIQAKAQQAQAREAKQRLASARPGAPHSGEEMATAATPSTEEARPARPGEAAAADSGTATVHLHFTSDLPDGVLIVWDKRHGTQKEIFREPFSRGGFLQRFRKPEPYETTRTLQIAAGTGELIIHVAPKGIPALREHRTGNFPGGSTRNLEVHLSKAAQLTVSLD